MLKDTPSSRLARWVTAAATLALMGSCKREEPAPAVTTPPVVAPSPTGTPPPAVAPAASGKPVPLAETFVLTDLTFRYDEKDSHLYVSYRVSNRGEVRERASFCIDFIDKDGFFVDQGMQFDLFRLSPGESDAVVDDAVKVSPDIWMASEVLRFYMEEGSCSGLAHKLRSNVVALTKSGLPPPPGTPLTGRGSAVDDEEVPSPWFRLDDVRVHQKAEGEFWADYRLTNLTKGRATSELCVRLVNDASCSCRDSHQVESERFNLGLNASELRSIQLGPHETWSQGQRLVIYTAPFGCGDPLEKATSNVITLAGPEFTQAPEPLEEEERGTGEGEDEGE